LEIYNENKILKNLYSNWNFEDLCRK
jgi:hypothetical protein